MNICLHCYRELEGGERNYHSECAESLFGSVEGVSMPYTSQQIDQLSQLEVTPIPLSIFEAATTPMEESVSSPEFICDDPMWSRFTLIRESAEIVDLTMKLAEAAHIVTAPHSLIRLNDDSHCVAIKRVDMNSLYQQLPMEDLCQISELPFEQRYEGSYEQIMGLVEECSSVNRIDVITLWEHVLFAWIVGNSDFNLKQIAFYEPYAGICSLSPLRYANSTALTDPNNLGVMALDVNGKRRGVKREDLERSMRSSGLKGRAVNLIFKKFVAARDNWWQIIEMSMLSEELKDRYKKLLERQIALLETV